MLRQWENPMAYFARIGTILHINLIVEMYKFVSLDARSALVAQRAHGVLEPENRYCCAKEIPKR